MATHHVEPSPATCHGNFSRDHQPILTIDDGDTVVFRTLEAGWCVEPMGMPGFKRTVMPYEPVDAKRGDGHCLCGPVAIRGAEPGMTLEVQIDEIVVGSWGWTACGWKHPVNVRLGTEAGDTFAVIWELDSATGAARGHLGHEIKLRPFMGVMGMPPDEPGYLPTAPPRVTGGNLDCKELIQGTTLFLPIAIPGGLFSVGDGHGVQGDGEACVTAIECPMERVVLTFRLHRDKRIGAPRARLHGAWMTLGVHEDLDEACFLALDEMLNLMIEQQPSLDRKSALLFASLSVDLRVTQIVNGVQGVHAILRDGAVKFP
jgi:acetamidase/formamidase